MRNLLIFIILTVFISSCQYRKTNKRHHFVQKQYSKKESIIIKDAIICANIGDFRNMPLEINNDSVLRVFVNSFQKLPIEFLIKQGKVYCNRDFLVLGRVKYSKFNFSELSSLIGVETNSVLIPIINFKNIPRGSPIVGFTPDPLEKNVFIDLAILIFRNKSLVYFKSRLFFTDAVTVNRHDESIDYSIKQENIDTLVQLTMKDYLERMK